MYEFRILSGRQAGARLRLPDGVYKVGADESCDIVVLGHGVEAIAFSIEVTAERLVVLPNQPSLGLAQDQSRTEPFALKPGQPFCLAELWMTLDHEAAEWPAPDSWLSAPEPEPAEENLAEAQQGAEAAASAAQAVPANLPLPLRIKLALLRRGGVLMQRLRTTWRWPAIALAAIAVCSCTAAYVLTPAPVGPPRAVAAAPARVDARKQLDLMYLNQLAASLGYGERLKFTIGADGTAILGGHVPSNYDLALVTRRLVELMPAAKVVAVSDEAVRDGAEVVVKRHNQQWGVMSVRDGVVELRGLDLQREQLEQVAAALRQQVPGVASVKVSTSAADAAFEALKSMIDEARLGSHLKVERNGRDVHLTGDLDAATTERFEAVLQRFNQQYGNTLLVSANQAPQLRYLPFRIRQFVAGPIPHVVTDSGERVFVGGTYQGYRLSSMQGRRVVFVGERRVEMSW